MLPSPRVNASNRPHLLTNLLFFAISTLTPPLAAMRADTVSAERWADSARMAIEAAFVRGRPEDVAEARRIAEHGLERFPNDALLRHYQGYGYFREGLLREGADARAVLEEAKDALERSLTQRELPESRAVLAAVFGNLIGSSVFRAVRFGRASASEMDRAVAVAPGNPRVWLLKGAGALYQPAIFGGGADKAEIALRKAIELFAGDHPAASMPAWGHAEVHGWLALALAKQGKLAEARAALAQGLAAEPGHSFLLSRVKPVVK